ncbi:MAG: threonine-phosphate decarboxylase CobD [Hyphomicrobiaceae bacterium]
MLDHGGNLDMARTRFGGTPEDWIDLSTGINRCPYPVPPVTLSAWTDLPTRSARAALVDSARSVYGTRAAIVPLAGAQAAIQMIPLLRPPAQARIITPTYNEHAACLTQGGWHVAEVSELSALAGADLAIVVNPNNPDGRTATREELLELAGTVRLLVVDESFADARPDLSVARDADRDGLIVLRSFGKFYGLAGLRLGFALGSSVEIARFDAMAGPWPVGGAAIEIGQRALQDRTWQEATAARLRQDVLRLDTIAAGAGWHLAGGTELFRLYRTPDALAAQDHLARARIWSRVFPWSRDLVRLGLPGRSAEWGRLRAALRKAPVRP